MSNTKHRLFVSYSRADAEFVVRLSKDLRAAFVNIWIDQLDVLPGQRWDTITEVALEDCRWLLVILSPESVVSENVRDEIAFALKEKKKILPVLYRDCKIPYHLIRMQYIDFRTDYDRGIKMLLDTLTM